MFILLNFLFIIAILVPASALAQGLVPCGNAGQPSCTLCHLYVLAKNVIDFGLFDLALPIAVIMLLIGGIILLTSMGSPEKLTRGKAILVNTLIGLVIAFAAWIIIATLLGTLGFNLPWADAVQRAWYEFPNQCAEGINALSNGETPETGFCTFPGVSPTCNPDVDCAACVADGGTCSSEPPEGCGTVFCDPPACNPVADCSVCEEGQTCVEARSSECPLLEGFCLLEDGSGNTECAKSSCDACTATDCVETPIGCSSSLAGTTQDLIDNGITFSSSADCGGASANTNKQELLDGNTTLTTCFDGCTSTTPCFPPGTPGAATLNPLILETLLDAAEAGF